MCPSTSASRLRSANKVNPPQHLPICQAQRWQLAEWGQSMAIAPLSFMERLLKQAGAGSLTEAPI
jgi:hypothetical protein